MNNLGLPDNLSTPMPEKAKSYELGVKSSIGSKLRINAAVFQLDYQNKLTTFEGVNYFNANYQGNNPNYGNFMSGTTFKSTSAYTVVDLFVGVAEQKGNWDLGLYAKNVFDKQVELARVATINSVYANFRASAGYDVVSTSLPREVGVKLRYAFGSR